MKGIKNENDGKKILHGIRRNGIRRNGKTSAASALATSPHWGCSRGLKTDTV